MSWRGLVAIVALLATGIVGGFAAAAYLAPQPVTSGVPSPVTATSPSVPVDPPAPLRVDPTEPPLATDMALRDVSVGTDKYNFVFPAPVGWKRIDPSSNEVKYKEPGNPENTYVLRVEQVISQHETIPDILAERIEDLTQDEDDYEEIRRTYDSLEFSYVHDGYRRFGFITWMDLTQSGQAEAEVALMGRRVDVPGMRELMIRIIRGIRRD